MKAFLIGGRKNKELLNIYKEIVKILKDESINVDETHITRTPEDDEINVEMAYKNNLRALKNSDFIVAEVTELSSGVGFLIATALNEKKPVIALHNTDISLHPSKMIKGAKNRLLMYYPYSTKQLGGEIKKALSTIKQKLDTKFILIIPAEIDRYLEWASKEKRMHKAQLVREAIESTIVLDGEYQEFLDTI